MPKRGEGKSRFESTPAISEAADKRRPVGAIVELTDGRLLVTISDARSRKGKQVVDCSALLVAPRLAVLFAEAIPRLLTKRTTARTRYQKLVELKHGFFAFCGGLPNAAELDSGDVTHSLVSRFVEHIKVATNEVGAPRYSLSTQRHFLSTLRASIRILASIDRIQSGITVPRLKGQQGNPTPPLDRDLYGRFLSRCRGDCLSTMTEVDLALNRAEELVGVPVRQRPRGHQLAKAMIDAFESYAVVPERKVLQRIDQRMFDVIEGVGYTAVRRAAHPMAQELTPFVYFLAGVTLYNAQPLMELKLAEVLETRILGVARMSLHPYKTRAHHHQHRSFAVTNEPDNPRNVIRFITRWTKRARSVAPKDTRESLFIFVPRNRKADNVVRPLYDRELGMSREFSNHSRKYCKKHGFPSIGTRALRATGADIADEIFDGDPVEVEALLGHVPENIRNPSYRSEKSRERDEEKLSGAMIARERWIASGGRVDSRLEAGTRDRSAATPGFRCLDLFNSPMPGERRGRACAAYGFCPTCPLAQPALNPAYAVARMLQLREKLDEARERLGMAVWLERFKAVADCIDQVWLPLLATDDVLEVARRIDLNPLPPIE
jgi:hypothetical protein